MDFNIAEELKKLPKRSGVYLMHGSRGEIIYIGKAKLLDKRVRQYFDASRKKSPKIERMVSQIACFEYIVTDSETEALILENNLIKEHRPRYNTLLKDDKTYPYIKLTLSEPFPRLLITRKVKKDGDKYYGPFPVGLQIKNVAEFLRKSCLIRTCRRNLPADIGKKRPCLNYHIGTCLAPCAGGISSEEYLKGVYEAKRFLEGQTRELKARLKQQMEAASLSMEYEKAQEYKELLEAASKIENGQKMEYAPNEFRDVLGFAREGFDAIMQVFFIRGGKLLEREHFYMTIPQKESGAELLSSFIKQYYSGTPFIPSEIHLPERADDAEDIAAWLSEKAGHKVSLISPQKGKKERMVELCEQNAALLLKTNREKVKREEARTKGAVREISELLGIGYARRMESFDISNISGYDNVGSMVVFEDGKPKKNDYRKFRVKSVSGADDFASMAEVIKRRFSHSEWERPDLLLIDGGKGQVHAARDALLSADEKGGAEIFICGMVKDDRHRTRALFFNEREYEMDKRSEAFRLVTRIQDETHRFAVEYHRSLRSKGQVHSVLDDIEGIGPKRRLSLIRAFKSVDGIKNASLEELSKADGMNKKAAEAVYNYFNRIGREISCASCSKNKEAAAGEEWKLPCKGLRND